MRDTGDRGLVSDAIEGLVPYKPGKPPEELERELGIEDALKLASNENVWGPSPRAVDAAREALASLHRYPDAAAYLLKRDLAAHHAVDPANIVVGNGSNELIGMLVRCFVRPGQSVLSSAGSFIAYRIAARAHGHPFVTAPLGPDLGYDLEALLAAADHTTRVVFIANPNNPTGTLIGADALRSFLSALDERCDGPAGPPLVALDEAYVDFVDRPDAPDGMAVLSARPRTVLLRTFSKAYGLAALRVGYALCEPDVADYLNRIRDPFNLSSVAQAAARAALADRGWLEMVVRETRRSRAELTERLTAMGLGVVPSQANFVLADVGRNGKDLNDALMRRGVIARPIGAAGLSNHLRVTVGRPEDNARFLDVLTAVLR